MYLSCQRRRRRSTHRLVFLTRLPTMAGHVVSRTDAASTDHRPDHGHPTIVLPVGTNAGYSRATGRSTSDTCGENPRARPLTPIHPRTFDLSGLWICIPRPDKTHPAQPLPPLSKRRRHRPALRHRFGRIPIWSSGQQGVRPVGCPQKGPPG
jgi:hypothetical protein